VFGLPSQGLQEVIISGAVVLDTRRSEPRCHGPSAASKQDACEGSVTHWISQLKAGDQEAAQQQLWDRYFDRLVALARQNLRALPQREADEEDVALSALNNFFERARRDQFPQLRNRNNLWPLLVKITTRKASNQLNKQRAEKRGGGLVQSESAFLKAGDEARIEEFVGSTPTPEFAAQMAEQCALLIESLDGASFRTVANMKLQGYANTEIAQRLDVSESTVERKLRQIRTKWSEDLAS